MKRVMRICLLAGLYGLLLAPMVWAQTASLSGTVTDADDGQSLPGASVLISGTAQGTATDFDGNYTITGLDREAVCARACSMGADGFSIRHGDRRRRRDDAARRHRA